MRWKSLILRDDNRGRLMFLAYIYFCVLYMTALQCPLRAPSSPLITSFDEAIPLIPWTIWIYFSHFIILLWALGWGRDLFRVRRAFYGMIVGTALAFLIFLFFPTELAVQEVELQGLTGFMWKALFAMDKPRNCLPSIHTSHAILAAYALSGNKGLWRFGGPCWALAIIASTLFTKQHVFADVFGGILLAATAYAVADKLCAKFITKEESP